MQDFIRSAAQQLNLPENTIQSASGAVLGVIQSQGGEDGASLLQALPGASDLAKNAGAPANGANGVIGSLLSKVTSMLGGGGNTLGLISALSQSGLGAQEQGRFISMFVDFAKQKAGADVVSRLLSKIPELGQLLGSR